MENIWIKYNEEKTNAMNVFCEDYKQFLSTHKTERECIEYTVSVAEKKWFY